MKLQFTCIACVLVLVSLASAADEYVLTNLNLVDVVDGRVIPDAAIVVEDGVIAYAGSEADAVLPSGAQRIDGRGRWAIPGLWDMHVHLHLTGPRALPVLLANGVTHVRDMGGDWDAIQSLREDIRQGRIAGPAIIGCGPFLESARWVDRAATFLDDADLATRVALADPEEVPETLDDLVQKGVDFIKIRTVQSKEVYFAVAQAARDRGLQLAGHAPPGAVSLLEASEAGQASIEHYLDAPGIRNLPEDHASAFRVFKQNGTHFVPTMVSGYGFRIKPTEEVLAIVDDASNAIDSRRRFMAPELLERWRTQLEMKESERFNWDYAKIHADNLRLFGEMHRAGVPLMIGTDLGAPFVFPGFSFHDELKTFVREMGISEMDALRAATIVPARFVGRDEEFGAIRSGLKADFVLLDGDPVDDIQNASRVSGVMHGRRWYAQEGLSRLLAAGVPD